MVSAANVKTKPMMTVKAFAINLTLSLFSDTHFSNFEKTFPIFSIHFKKSPFKASQNPIVANRFLNFFIN